MIGQVSEWNYDVGGIFSSLKLMVFPIFLFIWMGIYVGVSQDKLNVSKPVAGFTNVDIFSIFFCVGESNEHQPEK